ncbi:MAG TPA: glycosyltransferase family 39 protein [Thermoanaerobaculia bacterium]|nr:glycosyltransferase family 39 protein [Thermoanaerobaculia bacterium]
MGRRISRGEWLAFAAVILAFVLIRLPLFREPGLRLGWHSDAAAFGLIARDLYEGVPRLFWYGQSYMGMLTSAFGALAGIILMPFGVEPAVGPLALRLGTAIQWVLMMLLYWLGMRIAFGPAVALVTALLLTTGPDWFFHSQLAPRGGEMLLFLSAAVFALSVQGLARRRDWLLLGFLAGIGWWMHQGVIFAVGAALLVVVLRSRAWAIARRERVGPDHTLFMSGAPFALRLVNVILLGLVAAAIVREFVPRFPAFFLYHAVAEALAAWIAFRAVVALVRNEAIRDAIRHLVQNRAHWLPHAALFVFGALAGYAPVIVGKLAGMEEGTYGFSAPLQSPREIVAQTLRVARSDFWLLIGAAATPLGIVTTTALLVLLAAHIVRERRHALRGPRSIAGATILLCAVFYVVSSRAYEGAVRYIMPALPMMFAFAVAEAEVWWREGGRGMRALGAAAVLALTLGYTLQSTDLVRDLAAGRAEGRFFTGAGFSSGPAFDPRPVLAAIEHGGYEVCYADYNIAMMLEWLLDRRVRFLSYNSVEPRRELAQRLAALPVRKCFVDGHGNVQPWDPRMHDTTIGRTAQERLRRLRGQ